jgi:hypothetical protein
MRFQGVHNTSNNNFQDKNNSQPRHPHHDDDDDNENQSTSHLTTAAVALVGDFLSICVRPLRHSSNKQRNICSCITILLLLSLRHLRRTNSLVESLLSNQGTSSSSSSKLNNNNTNNSWISADSSKVNNNNTNNSWISVDSSKINNNTNNSWISVDSSKVNKNNTNNLWFSVESWAEGISGWKTSLSHILVLAKAFNATLVEPTISRARLGRCYNEDKSNNHNMTTLFDIFNRTLITNYHSKIVTCQQFYTEQHRVSGENNKVIYVDVCWGKQGKCNNMVPSSHSREYSPELWQGLRTAVENPHTMVVLRFHDVWQNSMNNLILPTGGIQQLLVVDDPTSNKNNKNIEGKVGGGSSSSIPNFAKHVATKYLHFKDSLVETLERKLRQHNIVTHSIIHWRAEIDETSSTLSYLDCAQAIVQARNAMMKVSSSHHNKKTETTFFVMSSLSSTNNDLNSWGGAHRHAINTTVPQAWELLRKEGIMTFDESVLSNTTFPDSIYYVVMDLILATKATMFSTCTKLCRRSEYNNICTKCNWIGKFAMMALEMRGNNVDGSLPCWPQTANETKMMTNKQQKGG